MAKTLGVKYVCSNCGEGYSTWSGRCRNCGEWNTLTEQVEISTATAGASGKSLDIQSISFAVSSFFLCLKTAVNEVDIVLGGGLVPGSVNLLAGQPGIGKRTLLLQVANNLAKSHKVLYISGEESARQVALRAERLGTKQAKINLAVSTSANDIASTIASQNYDAVIVDSIQAVAVNEISSAAGTVSQITNSAQLISAAAKAGNTALILVGHVTKEGSIAGPKVLEHMVDVVLQLEGDRYGGFKVLRPIKNRYGSTNEAGIFEKNNKSLEPVDNPSKALLAERQISDCSIVLATM